MTQGVAATESGSPFLVCGGYGRSEADADFYQPQEPTNQLCTVSVHARSYRQHYHPALWKHILGEEWEVEAAGRAAAETDSD